jgi:hypothetical protein
MATFISIIDPLGTKSFSIEIDSEKREMYEQDIFDLHNELEYILIICHKSGDEYYLPKQIAQKYLIKINTEF